MFSSIKLQSCVFAILFMLGGLSVRGQALTKTSFYTFTEAKLKQSYDALPDSNLLPRHVRLGANKWELDGAASWTAGFYPAMLWMQHQRTPTSYWLNAARRATAMLKGDEEIPWTHDLGFMVYLPYSLAYAQTKDTAYKAGMIRAARRLAHLYNPKVGTMLSWPWKRSWQHPTIIDNMMNLELLFETTRLTGDSSFHKMAVRHAEKTMIYHIRPDSSTYHVVSYDSLTGKPVWRKTEQGFSDSSTWARGQAWGVYGFAMAYEYTHDKRFEQTSKKLLGRYWRRLPADKVPYWDFDAPGIPNEPRDASAAAIAAAGMLRLARLESGKEKDWLIKQAKETIEALLSPAYTTVGLPNPAFLQHSTGSKPHNSEVDVSIVYADYYLFEAINTLNMIENVAKKGPQPFRGAPAAQKAPAQ